MGRKGDLLVSDEMTPLPDTRPKVPQVHMFEIGSEEEWPLYLNWLLSFGEVASKIPEANIGDLVVRRESGRYEVFTKRSQLEEAEKVSRYDERENQHVRLQILQTLGDVDRARAAEKWVLGTDEPS